MGQLVNRVVVRAEGITPPASNPFFWTDIERRRERFLLHLRDIFYQKTSKRDTQTDLVMLQKSTFAQFKTVTLRGSVVVCTVHHVWSSIFIPYLYVSPRIIILFLFSNSPADE
jgi:hypothetical protein